MAKRPKQKLTKMEKIERDIRLAYLKQERALKAIEKGKRDLMASAKSLARGHAIKRRLETKVASDLVRQAAPMGMVNDGEPVVAPTPLPAPKPKRQRKPKITETTDIPNLEIFGDPGPIDREARMKSMGFRRVSKRRQTPTNADTQ
jgi:hypothetical protein